MLKKKVDFKKVKKLVVDKRKSKLIAMLSRLRSGIIRRTQRGQDYKLRAFRPYTKRYADKKNETKVNLTASGKMLNSITWEENKLKGSVTFKFISKEQTDKATGNHFKNKRPFFRLDKNQIKFMKKQLSKL